MKLVHGILLLTIFALLGTLHILQSVEYFPSRKGPYQPVSVEPTTTTTTTTTTSNPAKVIVYEDCNYQGKSLELVPGTYTYEFLNSNGMNDKISSIKVPNGLRAEVFEHGGNQGRKWTFDIDNPCIIDAGANDIISSIVVSENQSSQLNSQGVKSDLEWINNRTTIGFDCRIKQKPEDEKYVSGWRDLAKDAYGEVSKAITRCNSDVRDAKSWLQWLQAQVDQGIQCEVEQNTTSSKAVENIRDIAKSSFDNINKYLDQCSGK